MTAYRNVLKSIVMIAAIVQISCMTTPITVTASTTPVQDKKISADHGRVQGSHRAWAVLGLWMVGRPDIDKAIQDALKQKGGDALINVTCYERTSWFFFVSSHQVVVEGNAVSLEKENPDAGKDKRDEKLKRKK
ncbi:MAG: hypothetical protein A2W19_03290 [Spirochaetes bacterium RBG_16_49_21]|nr:MAG: hypothetical protein A2W19_03290 [Spirochaetes bacterium RBG_16_49_21]